MPILARSRAARSIRYFDAWRRAQFCVDRCPLPSRPRVSLGPDGWTVVRQHRPQEHVLYRQRISWSVWVYLLCVAGHQGAEFDLYRDRAESFTPRLRYSGTSLGYQLASIIAGGPSPFIATALFATFNSSFPIALYIMACGIIGIGATALLTDYTNKDISAEYHGV